MTRDTPADRCDRWAHDLRAARAELGLDYSPDPFLFRQLARLLRAEAARDREAGGKTGTPLAPSSPTDLRGANNK